LISRFQEFGFTERNYTSHPRPFEELIEEVRDMIMKIFILCVSVVFGIFAIVIYSKGFKYRLKELADKPTETVWATRE
jgi:hypothetical protein